MDVGQGDGAVLISPGGRVRPGRELSWNDVFLSRDFATDPSERIRSSTIAVFVNPNNFQDYYMDLSSASSLPKGRVGQNTIVPSKE